MVHSVVNEVVGEVITTNRTKITISYTNCRDLW